MIQDFFDNATIHYLAQKPYWTINIDNKKPLDIIAYDKLKYIKGAQNDDCLTDLGSLIKILNAIPQQFVYSLDNIRDGVVVLDVEKKCPDDIKKTLLDLPFIYGDISMSGEGYHLVFPCPVLDEITCKKTVMREEHGYYEILLNHFVTFTNNTVFPKYDINNAPVQFQKIWDDVKSMQKVAVIEDFEIDMAEMDLDFPQKELLKNTIIRNYTQRFQKTPNDYFGDTSRYEFAVIGFLRMSLANMLNMPIFENIQLDTKQQIFFIYQIVKEILEYRPKHDEIRDKKPMLLYQIYKSFVTNYKTEKEE